MKKLAASVIFFWMLCALAHAGSELSTKEQPAPAPSCHDWSGPYIGGFGAYNYNTVDVDLQLSGPGWRNAADAKAVVESEGQHDLDNSGGELGAFAGYNWQYFKCWVFGLEADGGYLFGRESRDSGVFDPGDKFLPEHVKSSHTTHYLTTVGFHVGHAWGNLLPYVTGGLAIGDSDFHQRIAEVPGTGVHEGGSKDNTDVGGMVGAGLQYALNQHWSIRGQYEFVDLGIFKFHHQTTDPTFLGTSEAKVHEHNLSLAVIFQF